MINMSEFKTDELNKCLEILESYYNDIVQVEFVVESEKLYILSAHPAKHTPVANLKMVMSMFCEGKLDVEDVIKKLSYQELEEILNTATQSVK